MREHKEAGTATDERKEVQKAELECLNKNQKKAQDSKAPFFDEVLEPGAALIMTMEANLRTQHGVPEVAGAGYSGSMVFRTIIDIVPPGTKQIQRMM